MIEQEVLNILYFAIPGVITELYLRQYRPPKKRSEQLELYIFILYSVVEWSVFYIMIGIFKKISMYIPHDVMESAPEFLMQYGKYALMFLIILCNAYIIRKRSKIESKKLLPLDTAWDSYFLNNPHIFMEIHLNDGKVLYGEYAENSYASSDSENMDIYLERIFEVDENNNLIFDENGKPIESNGSKGILIMKEQIQYIKLFGDEA